MPAGSGSRAQAALPIAFYGVPKKNYQESSSGMSTKFTIHDIARLAGVSTTTVSRVLNQSSNVDPETRKRVSHVIKEHGFVPSLNAKGLKGQSQLIGLLMPTLQWTALLEVIRSVATYISEHTNYGIMLYTCPGDKDYRLVVDQILKTKLVGGLLTMLFDQTPEHFVTFYKQGLPVVMIDPIGVRADLPWVGVDHRGGAYNAVRYLLNLGHTRIAYIQGPLSYPCSLERYQGYCDALQEAGIVPDPHLFQQGYFNVESGIECGRKIFSLPDPPTAIFACNDEIAYGAIAAADESGISVPTDLTVVGFNDDPVFDYRRPILTTVHQPFNDLGRCAAELLLSLLNAQSTLSQELLQCAVDDNGSDHAHTTLPVHFQLPTQLIVRESSGPSPKVTV